MCGAEVVPYLSEAAFECNETAFSSDFTDDDMDFIVDSGASINIMSTKSNRLLSDSQQGTARISGFASTISARADRKGIIHLYFYNPANQMTEPILVLMCRQFPTPITIFYQSHICASNWASHAHSHHRVSQRVSAGWNQMDQRRTFQSRTIPNGNYG